MQTAKIIDPIQCTGLRVRKRRSQPRLRDLASRARYSRSNSGPCETNETDRKERSGPKKPGKTILELSVLVSRVGLTLGDVTRDGEGKDCPSKDVSDEKRDESESELPGVESPCW